ncbi:MAG: nuclear transport factor 2 family protein [Gammaproteobacteria bacterium]|nr:nuclear transport factor 2 family protein [Gammaproteobacteria bacterium]
MTHVPRSLLVSIALVAAFEGCSRPATPDDPAKERAAEEQILQLEKEGVEAGPRGDIGAFERVASDDYVIVDVDGSLRTKQEEIENFRKEKQTAQTMDNVKVRVNGDAAVVVGRFTIAGTYDGEPNNVAGRFTDVWFKRGGRWRLVSSQNTVLPDAGDASHSEATSAAAEKSSSAAGKQESDTSFINREREIWEALKHKDKASASRLLADDLTAMGPEGRFNRAQWLQQFDDQYTVDDYKMRDIKLLRPNPTTVILLYDATCKGTGAWKEICTRPMRVSDLWVKRGDQWLDFFSQDTIVVQ